MDSLDRQLRDILTRPMSKTARRIFFAVTAVCLYILMHLFHFHAWGMERELTLLLFFLAPLLGMIFLYHFGPETPVEIGIGTMVLFLAMTMRICFADHVSSDYEQYLAKWMDTLASQSFRANMQMQVGEYHVLYQYILFLLGRLPIPDLYAIKAVSFLGDVCLAGAALYLTRERRNLTGLLLLCLPAIAANGALYAQCDSLFTACAAWGVVFILKDRPGRGMAAMALSLCFKLQAVFVFPVLIYFYICSRIHLRDILVFVITGILVQLPAILFGKSIPALIQIYLGQTGLYTNLNYGAANLWGILGGEGLDGYAYGTFSIAMALIACLILLSKAIAGGKRTTEHDLLLTALMALMVFFLLPRMHERYIYLAEIMTWMCVMKVPRASVPAAFVSLSSLVSLLGFGIPFYMASFLVLVALLCLIRLFGESLNTP